MTENKTEYDLNKIYDYQDLPDKKAGRCDNCDSVSFKSYVANSQYIRMCNNCGMKKSI
ncbi:hypothetical protein ACDN41_12425 [Priestia aryabhattai]|uniref:hypothetical protein n=1 Tax=Priestia aryabhattai TaxID=412384 RepID=UPI003531B281